MQDPNAQWVLIKRGMENGMKQEMNQTTNTTAFKGKRFETKKNLNFR